MTKRIFAILLTIQLLIFGGTSAWAGSMDGSESAQDNDGDSRTSTNRR